MISVRTLKETAEKQLNVKRTSLNALGCDKSLTTVSITIDRNADVLVSNITERNETKTIETSVICG